MKRNKLFFVGLLLIVALLITALPTFAGPVEPSDIEMEQPNGVAFTAVPFGDEWYSGYEHEGYTFLLDKASGYFVYADANSQGELVPTSLRVGIDDPSGLTPHLRDLEVLANVPINTMPKSAGEDAWPGVFGSQPVLLLLVDFTPSTSLGTTAAQWNTAFYDDSAAAKSVKNFYDEASYNNFTVDPPAETQGTTDDGVIEVTLNYAHPNTGGSTGDANRQIVRDALIAADGFIDYSSFDTNNNNAIDVTELHIITIARGWETAFGGTANACSPSVWGHRWSLFGSVPGPTLDGVTLGSFANGGGYMQFGEWHDRIDGAGCPTDGSEGNMATIGIMAHELGHDINWPDLYDTDGSSNGDGYWSVMASGSWAYDAGEPPGMTPTLPDPFSKWYQHWLTPVDVESTTTAVNIPNSAQNPTVYQLLENVNGIDWEFGSSSGTSEYFLIENRQQVGFDAGLARIDPSVSGCVIWHIDETRTSGNSNNNNENRKHVDVEEANAIVQELDNSTTGNRGDTNDVWPGANALTTFNDTSTPNSKLYDNSVSGVTVTNISTAGNGCTVDFVAGYDYGDLPDDNTAATYPTDANAANGVQARHLMDGSTYLGSAIDGDFMGLPSAAADGDDNSSAVDDEDGVLRKPGLGHPVGWSDGTVAAGEGGHLELTITGTAVPQVFIDFNEDGTLTEVVLRDAGGTAILGAQTGVLDVYFDVPVGTFDGTGINRAIATRVRLSPNGGLLATGTAIGGEVEDYIFQFVPTAITLQSLDAIQNTTLPVVLGLILLTLLVLGFFVIKQRKETSVS